MKMMMMTMMTKMTPTMTVSYLVIIYLIFTS